MGPIRLRVFALLASQGLHTVFVYVLDVLLNGFFDRHFNIVLFTLVDVAVDVYKSRLTG